MDVGANIVVANDKLDFSAFSSGLSFSTTVIEHNGTTDVDITNNRRGSDH